VATEAARQATETARDGIFALVLKHEHYFRQVDGLPDVKGFLAACEVQLRSILEQRWKELLPESQPPLVVNVLINPNLFFCHRDAVQGQYHKYFRPVYLDREAIQISQGHTSADVTAQAIVSLHETFDKHYDMDISDANRAFLSLNDIEALRGEANPLPPAGTVISISRIATDAPTRFSILSDANDYWPEITKVLLVNTAQTPIERFEQYLQLVTSHSGSYHHVTIGSTRNWTARVYLAFRGNGASAADATWIAKVKDFAFDVVAPMALAGTFVRNGDIVLMLEEVGRVFKEASDTRRRHGSIFDQFRGTVAKAHRKVLPTITHLGVHLSDIHHHEMPKLTGLHQHVKSCSTCVGKKHYPLSHGFDACFDLGDVFVNDIVSLVKSIGDFNSLNDVTAQYVANALAFGLTVNRERPQHLKTYFDTQQIPEDWIRTCQTARRIDEISELVQPYVRALLLMVGNRPMVETNASRVGLALGDGPTLNVELHGERVIARVEYKISGVLTDRGCSKLNPVSPAKLHSQKNGLLLHFGHRFLDDFQMYISTATDSDHLVADYQWPDAIPAEGAIVYSFRCTK
jgi:hypothetical protein